MRDYLPTHGELTHIHALTHYAHGSSIPRTHISMNQILLGIICGRYKVKDEAWVCENGSNDGWSVTATPSGGARIFGLAL